MTDSKTFDEMSHDEQIQDLLGKLSGALDIVEAYKKSDLMKEIIPRTTTGIPELFEKSLDELQQMRDILVDSVLPTFMSGTPMHSMSTRDHARSALDNTFNEAQAKRVAKKQAQS